MLRHTVACEMVSAGVPLVEIAQVLRHRSLQTTAVYALVASVRTAPLLVALSCLWERAVVDELNGDAGRRRNRTATTVYESPQNRVVSKRRRCGERANPSPGDHRRRLVGLRPPVNAPSGPIGEP